MRAAWTAEALFLGALLLAALALGALIGPGPLPWVLAALLAVAVRHIVQIHRLESWLRAGRRRHPPQSWGIWGEIFEHYYRLQRRYYKRKKRLSRVIREFRDSTAAMPDGTVVLDPEWRIVWCNDAAENLLRLSARRDRGQLITSLVRSPAFDAFLRGGRFDQAVEVTSPRDDRRTLSVRIVPYGQGQRLMLVRDITRMKRLEAMRRDFVANASHELRSPLTVLSGYLESLAEDEGAPPDWRQPLKEMQTQCRRMGSLVNDLLELSRLEIEESDQPGSDPVNVPAMIRRIVDEARGQDTGGRSFETDIDDDLWLGGNEGELFSALSNLVINALRYTDDGGRISVQWSRGDDGGALFSVIDDGIGIDARHLPFITQRFYRVDASRSRALGGSGLGLAIVKHVMNRHQGRLDIASRPGEGSRFTCCFPASRVAAPVIAE